MAMKFAWRNRAEKLGLDLNAHKPNLVISKRLSSLLGKILCLLGYRDERSPYG